MASGAEGSEDCCRRTLAPELQMYVILLQSLHPTPHPKRTAKNAQPRKHIPIGLRIYIFASHKNMI